MSFSTYLEGKIIRHVFANTTYAPPSTLYVALWTDATTPNDSTPGFEVTGGGYARVAIPASESNLLVTGGSPTTISNKDAITWSTATTNWGNVKYAALYDASTGGNCLEWGALQVVKTVTTGDIMQIAVGAYSISLN